MKVYLSIGVLLLSGCAFNNTWVKSDNTMLDESMLNKALVKCDYKKKMRASNVGFYKSSHGTEEARAGSSSNNVAASAAVADKDNSIIKSAGLGREANLSLGQQAYRCMVKEGFERA